MVSQAELQQQSIDAFTTQLWSCALRSQSRIVREETRRLRRYAAWHHRLVIAGGSGSLPDEVVDELRSGPLCVECVATRRRLTLTVVEQAVVGLRGTVLLDTVQACNGCGARRALVLHPQPAVRSESVVHHSRVVPIGQAVRRSLPLDCAIAGREVKVQWRSGRHSLERGPSYVRCSERDCQYADRNVPPCPLRSDMFGLPHDARAIVEHLVRYAGRAFCFGCLTRELSVEHDVLRWTVNRLSSGPNAVVHPARCRSCHGRHVTIAILSGCGEAAMSSLGLPPTTSVVSEGPHPTRAPDAPIADASGRILAGLRTFGGRPVCGACLALAVELPLTETRQVLGHLAARAEVSIELGGTCDGCGRCQDVAT